VQVRTWTLVALVLAAGCRFDGEPAEGFLCPTGECPAGQQCIDGVCVVDPEPDFDANVPDHDAADVPPIDAAPPVDAFDDPTLRAWWEFEDAPGDGVLDSSGNGHTGGCAGTTCPTQAAGRIGMAYDFDGADDYVRVPGGGDLATGSAVTISGWVFLREVTNQAPLSKPFHVNGSADTNSWQYEVDSPAQGCLTGPTKVCTADVVVFDQWQHFAAIWSGAGKRLYLDGTMVMNQPAILQYDGSDVVIGADYHLDPDTGAMTSTFVHVDGLIDEVRIYNRALSDDEITALANP
jgi:hypothetical protein